MELPRPAVMPPLDPDFRPAALAHRAFRGAVENSGAASPVAVCLERADGSVSRYETPAFAPAHPRAVDGAALLERLVKNLLWQRGGWRVTVAGPAALGEAVAAAYRPGGPREFDRTVLGERVYDRPFEVLSVPYDQAPAERESTKPLGRHLDGCRIGFDLGASDRKSSAVIDGEAVFSTEVPWDPKNFCNPQWHYDGIQHSLELAAAHLPRVDAIGGSAAGVYVNNRVRIASLFLGVPEPEFGERIVDLFARLRAAWGGVPFEVVNDGEVTALAGSMSLGVNAILGLAMGSSLASGFVTPAGSITGWLNELAFAPIDYSPTAPVDPWSGDRGVGALYLSQQAVCRLAPAAGLALEGSQPQAEQLKVVQALMAAGDPRARRIYETIGVYLGYAVAHYADFYPFEHALILGRVTSGPGGEVILAGAREVLAAEFADLAGLRLLLPDERSRRVGQSIAAASLPRIGR